MSSDPTATPTSSRDRTEAGEWFAIGAGVLVVALVLAGAAWTGAEGDARVVVAAFAAVAGIAGFLLLVVGAVITGTTIALRAERARLERERSTSQTD